MVNLGVSENRGTPKSSILRGFSIIFTILFGYPLFLETPISGFSLFVTWQVSSRSVGWEPQSWTTFRPSPPTWSELLVTSRWAACVARSQEQSEVNPGPGGEGLPGCHPQKLNVDTVPRIGKRNTGALTKHHFGVVHVRISRLQKSPQHLDGFDRVACSSWKGDTCKFHASGTRGSSEGLPFKLEQKSYLVLVSQLIRRTACFLFALHCSAILQKSPGILFELGSSCTLFTFYYYHQQCSTWEPTWSSWFWDSCVSHQLRRCSRVKLWSH